MSEIKYNDLLASMNDGKFTPSAGFVSLVHLPDILRLGDWPEDRIEKIVAKLSRVGWCKIPTTTGVVDLQLDGNLVLFSNRKRAS